MKVFFLLMSFSMILSSIWGFIPAVTAPTSRRHCDGPSIFRVASELNEEDVLDVPDFEAMMMEDDDDDYVDDDDDDDEQEVIRKPHSRWSALHRNAKAGMQKTRQDRIIKQRQESKQDKKRRIMMFMKEADRNRKLASRVDRKIPLDMRTPLSALKPGTTLNGIVISLTNFGAYIDVGTECDGLLHVSQISNTYFVEHARQILTPGDEVEVTIKSLNPELKKLHLTMLQEQQEEENDEEERIMLDEIEADDELWGEIVRVTDYGAYVELGAQVRGFLHFMDHPMFGNEPGAHPNTFMNVGDRVRAWVVDVDRERDRIKLTANRPLHLPGPRRELF